MGDRTLPMRVSLIALLSADTSLQSLIGAPARVYDNVPKGTLFPYIRVGETMGSDRGTKSMQGQEFELTIHTYDQSPINRGQKTINQIQSAIYDLLHEKTVLSSYLVRFKSQFTTNDDGLSWHGVSRYRVLTWGTPDG